jgi:transcriptional regulator GlxA family with amidase domain
VQEAISIIDLLRICGCSRRVLFSAFRSARSYTPMELLTEQRLQHVREKLLNPHLEASICSIALNCGFIHFGRFLKFIEEDMMSVFQIRLKRVGKSQSGHFFLKSLSVNIVD